MKNKIQLVSIGFDEEIVLFKKGSGGTVLARHSSIAEIVERETPFNPEFSYHHVYPVLSGRSKYFSSFYHSCKVVARIRKKAA